MDRHPEKTERSCTGLFNLLGLADGFLYIRTEGLRSQCFGRSPGPTKTSESVHGMGAQDSVAWEAELKLRAS